MPGPPSFPTSEGDYGPLLLLLFGLACGLAAGGPLASYAQSSGGPSVTDSTEGRRAALRAARAAKGNRLDPPEQAGLERLLLWIEDEQVLQKIGSIGGKWKQYRVGPAGLGSGSGLGLRLLYVPFPLRPSVDVRVNVGASVRGYWRLGGSVGYRHNGGFGYLYSQAQRRAQRTYYLDLQNTAGPDDRLRFNVTDWTSGGGLGVNLLPSLSLSADASYLRYTSSVNAETTRPQDPDILNPALSTHYLSVGGHLRFDRRNVQYESNVGSRVVSATAPLTDRPLNPNAGTLLSIDVRRFQEVSGVDADFHQAEAELQQYVSIFNGYHTLALRHRTVLTGPADATVPYYQLPYVGGDFTVRGYDAYRFRGPPHGLLYNLEYRYKVWHHADMVLFGDAGKVFDEVQQWGVTNLRYAYGTGLRLTTTRSAYFRVEVAFDEERSPRLILQFSNVF